MDVWEKNKNKEYRPETKGFLEKDGSKKQADPNYVYIHDNLISKSSDCLDKDVADHQRVCWIVAFSKNQGFYIYQLVLFIVLFVIFKTSPDVCVNNSVYNHLLASTKGQKDTTVPITNVLGYGHAKSKSIFDLSENEPAVKGSKYYENEEYEDSDSQLSNLEYEILQNDTDAEYPANLSREKNCEQAGICGSHAIDARDIVIRQNKKENNNYTEKEHSIALSEIKMFGSKSHFAFIHIPKTGGTSVKRFIHEVLPNAAGGERGFNYISKKYAQKSDLNLLGFFREPRAHVFSQFMHCKYNPYHSHRNYNGFQRTSKDEAGDVADFEAWLDHFNSPEFAISITHGKHDLKNTVWDCYNPYNMQARYYSSNCRTWDQCHQGNIGDVLEPPLVEAIENLERLAWFGLTEHMRESLCLLQYQQEGQLDPACICGSEAYKNINIKHVNHGIPHHNVMSLNLRIKRKIDHITRIDRQFYAHAKDILLARLVELQRITNVTLVCDSENWLH